MKFDLELFKQVVESDVSELEKFREVYDTFLDSIEDEHLETVLYKQLTSFIDKHCNGVHIDNNVKVFMTLIISKYSYEQGLKDGEGD